MTLEGRRYVIAALGGLFLVSLLLVQWMETARRAEMAGLREPRIAVPAASRECVECHGKTNPGIIAQWKGSPHAAKGVACVDCHQAAEQDVDAYMHHHVRMATVVSPLDCGRCHEAEADQFAWSRHASGGDIHDSLDIVLAETVEGAVNDFNPYSSTPGWAVEPANGTASAVTGCRNCHGSTVAFQSIDGGMITADDLRLDAMGRPTHREAFDRIVRDENGRPLLHPDTWPNTGIGRLNFDGSRGSCSACHSRHDFSVRRARQPESCSKCHRGPDHAQMEIFEASTHGIVYGDVASRLKLDRKRWVLGEDYAEAPTCATCHLSGNQKNGGIVTHDPGQRISWSHRPSTSLVMDTDANHAIVTEVDLAARRDLIVDSAEDKRYRMKEVCAHCHTVDYVNWFYSQYDDLVHLYNEKFAKPGRAIMSSLTENGALTAAPFDEEIEWAWFSLWHDAGRRARHGAAMMAPEHSNRRGMREVAEIFYMELLPRARELADRATRDGRRAEAAAVRATIDEILLLPEHRWIEGGDSLRRMPQRQILPAGSPQPDDLQ